MIPSCDMIIELGLIELPLCPLPPLQSRPPTPPTPPSTIIQEDSAKTIFDSSLGTWHAGVPATRSSLLKHVTLCNNQCCLCTVHHEEPRYLGYSNLSTGISQETQFLLEGRQRVARTILKKVWRTPMLCKLSEAPVTDTHSQ